MKKKNRRYLYLSVSMLSAFVLWTVAVQFVDVRAIGPNGSSVGFATINGFIHKITGVHMSLYDVTDWLGLVPIFVATGFALLGFAQWIKRKHLSKVDYSIFVLGGFYIAVMAVYILFEMITVNYRPILINGILEKSYPSSTTLLVMCVMPTAIMQFNSRIKNKALKKSVSFLITAFIVFMVVGRLVSGVHWFTDIIGGALLSAGLVMMYRYATASEKKGLKQMDNITIRLETEKDYRAVEELTREAFWNVYKPGADEHYYVNQMRNHPDFIPELAFILEKDGKIIGNIMYTKAWLEDENREKKEILSFGPLCVAPEYQRQKLGKILIEHSFDVARKMGYDVNINFGNPANYVGRGFVSCKKKNISFIVDGNFPTALLVCELVPDALDGRKWMYIPSTAADCCENTDAVEAFDATFPPKEKKWMPSQEEFYIYSHSSVVR